MPAATRAKKVSKDQPVNDVSSESSTGQKRSNDKLVKDVSTTSSTDPKPSNLELAQKDSTQSSTSQKRSRSGQVKKDTIVSSTEQKPAEHGQAKNDKIILSYRPKHSNLKLLQKKSTQSSTSHEPSGSGQAKDDTAQSSTGQNRLRPGQAKKDTIVSSIAQKPAESGQAKNDITLSSTHSKHSNLELVQKKSIQSSTSHKPSGSGQAKNDTAQPSIGQKRPRSGQAKKDTIVLSTKSDSSKLDPVVESSTGQKQTGSVQSNNITKLPTGQKRGSSGIVKPQAPNSSPVITQNDLALYMGKHAASTLDFMGKDNAFDSFTRWYSVAKTIQSNRTANAYMHYWLKYKEFKLKCQEPTFDSFESALFETFEAFCKCVGYHFPGIIKRIEPTLAYALFMSWKNNVEAYCQSEKIDAIFHCDARAYIIHWMELLSDDADYASGEVDKEKRCRRYRWVRCQDPDCPHRSSDKPEQGHTHFYDYDKLPATATLMLFDVGLFTFQEIMPATKNWQDQIPSWPVNPTLKRHWNEWSEEDQNALLASKGLLRKYIIVDDEGHEEEEALDAAKPNKQKSDGPTPQMATVGENTAETANANNEPTAGPNAQTTNTAKAKRWGEKTEAEAVQRITADPLSQAKQDKFCEDYYDSVILPDIPRKKIGGRSMFSTLPSNPDEPFAPKTNYFNYGSNAPEEEMDTRAKFNLPLSRKKYAEYYGQFKKAKEQNKPLPYDRSWMEKAGISEWAASNTRTSLIGVSNIKLEDLEQFGVLVRDDILYIKYNVGVRPAELETQTKSKKKAKKTITPLYDTPADGPLPKHFFTSQKRYTEEIRGRLIGFGRDKKVHLHVNGFVTENGDPLVVRCIGPQVILETFIMLAPDIETSRDGESCWAAIEVRSQTGEEFGSLYRIRQQYELFKAEMDEWAGNAGVQWRTTVNSAIESKKAKKKKREDGVMNGDFDKKPRKKLSKEEQDARKAEKQAKEKKLAEDRAERDAKAKAKAEAKAKREAAAKEKLAKAQAAKSKGKGKMAE